MVVYYSILEFRHPAKSPAESPKGFDFLTSAPHQRTRHAANSTPHQWQQTTKLKNVMVVYYSILEFRHPAKSPAESPKGFDFWRLAA
jgi:hypothetical protein